MCIRDRAHNPFINFYISLIANLVLYFYKFFIQIICLLKVSQSSAKLSEWYLFSCLVLKTPRITLLFVHSCSLYVASPILSVITYGPSYKAQNFEIIFCAASESFCVRIRTLSPTSNFVILFDLLIQAACLSPLSFIRNCILLIFTFSVLITVGSMYFSQSLVGLVPNCASYGVTLMVSW